MGRWIASIKQESLNKYVLIMTVLFILVTFLVAHLGGDNDYITFRQGVIMLIAAALPGLAGTVLVYIKADPPDRQDYNVRFGLVALSIVM